MFYEADRMLYNDQEYLSNVASRQMSQCSVNEDMQLHVNWDWLWLISAYEKERNSQVKCGWVRV